MECNIITSFASGTTWPCGVAMNGSNIFLADQTGTTVDKLEFDSTAGADFSMTGLNAYSWGMELWQDYFYVLDYTDKSVYKYYNAPYIPPVSTVTTTLNKPEDYYNSSTNSIEFNCSAITVPVSGEVLTNITLWLNQTGTWVLNETKDVSGTSNISIFTKNIQEGINHQWNCVAYDDSNVYDWGTNRTLTIDATYPQLTATLEHSIVYVPSGNVTINYTATDTNLQSCWYNYNSINKTFSCLTGVNNITNVTSVSPITAIILYANDSVGNVNSTSLSFTYDTGVPAITINQPTGTKDYGYEGKSETLNWTIVDTNLASVWYNYNGTNYTLTGAINSTTFTLETSPFNLTLWANDSLGNQNKANVTWSYDVFETAQSYVSKTYEGKTNPFSVNFSYTSANWNVATGTLVYNNTNYSGSKTGSGDNLVFTSNTYAPNVGAQTNISFYWRIGLTNTTGTTNIEATTYNQTVKIINMSICGGPHIVPFLNFTCYDETTYAVIPNCTTSVTFDYKITGANFFQSYNYDGTAPPAGTFDFCFSPPSEDYTLNSVMEYDATGYAQRYYNFEGIEFTNTTTEIGLYLLNTTSSTSFIVVVQDANYQPLAGVEVYMQKYNAGTGNWITVEIAITNDDGETIAHVYTEDSIYRFKIYDDGTLVHTSTGSVIACPAVPCTVTITLSESITPVIPIFDDLDDLTTSLTYSKTTEVITYTYSDTSGSFSKARLFVIRSNPGIPDITYTCNSTSGSSTAVLTCDLTGEQNGTYIASGFITRLAEAEKMVERKAIQKIRDIVGVIGLEGVLWSMFLFIGILMLGVYRPSLGIIFGIVGLILISYLELMQLSITAIVAVVAIGAILLVEARKQ